MKLFESFRSAVDKYGEELAREMLNAGIPAKYILAACRFHHEANGKSSDILAVQFRQWMSFVVPTNKIIDVNKLSYAEFTRTIDNVKKANYTPNCLYEDGVWSVGRWYSFQEARLYPIENKWCICHSLNKWKEYAETKGSVFYIVNCSDMSINAEYRHVCVEIERNGEIYFWFADNQSTHSDFLPEYFNLRPQPIRDIIYGKSNEIGNKHNSIFNESKTNKNMNKNTLKLNESQLRNIVAESVKKALSELYG